VPASCRRTCEPAGQSVQERAATLGVARPGRPAAEHELRDQHLGVAGPACEQFVKARRPDGDGDVSTEQVFRADELRFTRDPFDALICAAAQAIDLPLITRDAQIRRSGTVKVVW